MLAKLDALWQAVLKPEFNKPYMYNLCDFLSQEALNGVIVYPPDDAVFNAFKFTPYHKVKVVILGQDPYHGPNQAHGLSFSVQKGVAIPPSLKNIFKELVNDVLGFKTPPHGNLNFWATQGVLLLNACLTVEANKPASHQMAGWQNFTDEVIKHLSNNKENLVFILWGKFAQTKAVFIDERKHLVLAAVHPSPFSAHRGFLGSKPFSKTNAYLKANGISEIDWCLG